MPYNNAPISPPEKITGSSALPLARVKKIIAQDDEIAQCSNSAAFAISVATEIFIRHLTEQAHTVVKSERKPRRNIAYKDIATAVSRIDNLEFLSDMVPKTKPYRQVKEDQARQEAAAAAAKEKLAAQAHSATSEPGLKPLDQMIQQQQPNGHAESLPSALNGTSPTQGQPRSTLVERTILQNGYGHQQGHHDVQMTG